MHRSRLLATTSAALSLTIGAVALAAPDRTAELSGATATYEWDGGPLSGTVLGLDTDRDDTLLKLKEGGNVAISLSNFSEPTGTGADFDIRVYKADAEGNADGEALGEGIEADTEKELLTVKNLKPGAYVVEVNAFATVNGTFHGKATYSGTGLADLAPDARVNKPKRAPKKFTGTASDDTLVTKVEIALQAKKGRRCKQLLRSGRFGKQAKCDAPTSWMAAKGTTAWSFKLKKKLARGSYTLFARATDNAGQVQAGFTPANKRTFKVR
jgi:hypothetical protein